MSKFPKEYDFKTNEAKWQQYWRETKVYSWKNDKSRQDTFVIDTPPITVSGQLHIGHVYSYTHADLIARYKRMMGFDVFYPMGFDDNGLPTERLVENRKKLKASKLERIEFVKLCQQVIIEEEEKFRKSFSEIALSVDWDLEYQTISDVSQKIAQLSFLDLIKKGEMYRSSQPILWDPVDQTALAQAEIQDKTRISSLNEIRFITDDGQEVLVATTRPELLPACRAVFYHPDDKRYDHLHGRFALTPLFNIAVPIISDSAVDPEKGTGLVMCCTFGDQMDVVWWRKYGFSCRIIITKVGTIDKILFEQDCRDIDSAQYYAAQLEGIKIEDARRKIIALLEQNGKLAKQTEATQVVKCAERSGAPLEIITTPQWFVRTIQHREALKTRSSELIWHPLSMKIRLDTWIDSVAWDWCISRQRFFGVPFPVWYSLREGESGKPIFAAVEQLPVDPLRDLPIGYEKHEVVADQDVMDTWAISAISPQLNSHGIASDFMLDEARHKKLFPADLRPQAHEIIRTWTFYTALKAHLHANSLPWHNIMISGWCLAEDRSKMSKSKGNVIEPQLLLARFGSDVVRYWAASSRLGSDTVYSEDVMKNGKRLVNKIWNAAKFVAVHFDKLSDECKNSSLKDVCCLYVVRKYDQYFLAQLQKTLQAVTEEYEKYEYAVANAKLENFFWSQFCDNYLEIIKTRAYDEGNSDSEGRISAVCTLYHSFLCILRMFAPVLPHITEELYQMLYATRGGLSIHARGNWPEVINLPCHNAAYQESEILVEIVELVRKAKTNANMSVKVAIDILEIESQVTLSQCLISDLENVTGAKTVSFLKKLDNPNKIVGEHVSVNLIGLTKSGV